MDAIIKRPLTNGQTRAQVGGGIRKHITALTDKAMRRMKLHFRNMDDSAAYMVTLTYPAQFPMDGLKVKRDLVCMKQWFKRRNVSAAWFLEFQERGAPHLHLITDKAVGTQELSEKWYQVVGSGDEKHLMAGTQQARLRKPHAVAAYVAKYASKTDQKTVPDGYTNVGRFWGAWGVFRKVDAAVMSGEVVNAIDGESSPDSAALQSVVRSAKKLVKSRGFKVRDNGVYGLTLWGVGFAAVQALADFYGYTGFAT